MLGCKVEVDDCRLFL